MSAVRKPYRVAAGISGSELREKGSRFLAILEPLETEEEARRRLQALTAEHTSATHICWAWRIGQPARERCSDSGEPAGTAGIPILQVLRGAGLSDVLAVVVRWYGGIKLGKGGLARAYAQALRQALVDLRIEERIPTVTLEVRLPYLRLGEVKRLIHPPKVEVLDERYTPDSVELVLRVGLAQLDGLQETLAGLGAEVRSAGE